MFKILSTNICLKKYVKWNIWKVVVRPSYIEDARFLKVKIPLFVQLTVHTTNSVSASVCFSPICRYCVCLSDNSLLPFMVYYISKHRATLH
jgi:hypothetical protein